MGGKKEKIGWARFGLCASFADPLMEKALYSRPIWEVSFSPKPLGVMSPALDSVSVPADAMEGRGLEQTLHGFLW